MSTVFDPLGFAHSYRAEVDVEVPAGGEGGVAHLCFGRDGRHIEEFEFEPRWGAPLVVRIDPRSSSPWFGSFAAGGLGVARGVFATPSASRVCVVVDGLAFVVDVDAPEQPANIAANAVVSVQPLQDPLLLLLVSDSGLAAIDAVGCAWSAPRLVVDDLRLIRASSEAIVCSGNIGDRMATVTLTPQTGAVWGSDYR